MITLVASDNTRFYLPVDTIQASSLLQTLQETNETVIELPTIPIHILAFTVDYLQHHTTIPPVEDIPEYFKYIYGYLGVTTFKLEAIKYVLSQEPVPIEIVRQLQINQGDLTSLTIQELYRVALIQPRLISIFFDVRYPVEYLLPLIVSGSVYEDRGELVRSKPKEKNYTPGATISIKWIDNRLEVETYDLDFIITPEAQIERFFPQCLIFTDVRGRAYKFYQDGSVELLELEDVVDMSIYYDGLDREGSATAMTPFNYIYTDVNGVIRTGRKEGERMIGLKEYNLEFRAIKAVGLKMSDDETDEKVLVLTEGLRLMEVSGDNEVRMIGSYHYDLMTGGDYPYKAYSLTVKHELVEYGSGTEELTEEVIEEDVVQVLEVMPGELGVMLELMDGTLKIIDRGYSHEMKMLGSNYR